MIESIIEFIFDILGIGSSEKGFLGKVSRVTLALITLVAIVAGIYCLFMSSQNEVYLIVAGFCIVVGFSCLLLLIINRNKD